jgi:hypothetical protein
MEQHKEAEQREKFNESRKKENFEMTNLQKRIIKNITLKLKREDTFRSKNRF